MATIPERKTFAFLLSIAAVTAVGAACGDDPATTESADAGPADTGASPDVPDVPPADAGDSGAPATCNLRFGDRASQIATSLAVADDGSILLGGTFAGSLDLGGAPLVWRGRRSGFVAKLDASCKHVWSQRAGGRDSEVRSVGVDAQGAAVALVQEVAGGPGLFKVSATGAAVWGKSATAGAGFTHAVAPDGSVAVAASLGAGTWDFGGGKVVTGGVFVGKLDASGNGVWAEKLPDGTSVRALAFDATGNVIVSGTTPGIDWDAGVVSSSFLMKLGAAAGAHQVLVAGAGSVIAVHPGGDVVVASKDAIERRDGTTFAVKWTRPHTGSFVPTSIAIDKGGAISVAGLFGGAVTSGGASLTSEGAWDAFLLRTSDADVLTAFERFTITSGDEPQFNARVAYGPSGLLMFASTQGDLDLGHGLLSNAFTPSEDLFLTRDPKGITTVPADAGTADAGSLPALEIASGAATDVAVGPGLAVDGTDVYWVAAGATESIVRCPVGGCPGGGPQQMVATAAGYDMLAGPVVDANNLYFASRKNSDGLGEILRCSLAPNCGGAAPEARHTAVEQIGLFTADTSAFFWSGYSTPSTSTGIFTGVLAGGSPWTTFTLEPYASSVAPSGSDLFYGGGNGVFRCAKVGCGGTKVAIDDDGRSADFVSVAGTDVCWKSNANVLCSKAAGGQTPVVVAANVAGGAVAQSGGNVYFGVAPSGLAKCPIGGCPAAGPTMIATDSGYVRGLAFSSTHVFWIAGGRVLRAPK